MRALRGIQPLYHSRLNYKRYNFMDVPNLLEFLRLIRSFSYGSFYHTDKHLTSLKVSPIQPQSVVGKNRSLIRQESGSSYLILECFWRYLHAMDN